MQSARSKAELQHHKTKLANSYSELLNEFSSHDLRHVGSYTLGKLIGKGSFGKVYLARHNLTNGSKVVLKASKKDDTNLVREIHHHRQFIHPHIARLYEVIVTESQVWLVLEYCPGDELYHYLLKKGPLPIETAQKIFTQLVGAVAYIHSKSCVHRDLKLENVLLDKHENVKLCDFGFTREYEGKSNYLQTFCGTICYSAPEMLRAEKYAGEKVDVWSLGIILFALLKGELPFDEDDDQATKAKILKDDLVLPETFPDGAKTLLSKLLSKRPLHRPTLAEVLADPFLADYAPQQQATLKLTQPHPFTTSLEKVTLERMKSAGVDIDKVIENVLSQRCDSLAGWWALLIEKEQRKEAKREKRRKEKDAEAKLLRRLSAASSRLDRITIPLEDVPEHANGPVEIHRHRSLSRGRSQRRSTPQILVTDLPQLPEGSVIDSAGVTDAPLEPIPPTPVDKDSIRSRSGSRPPLPAKERRRQSSTLNIVTNNLTASGPAHGITKRRRRRGGHQILHGLAQIKQWLVGSTKLGRHQRRPDPTVNGKSLNLDIAKGQNTHTRQISGNSLVTHSFYGGGLTPIEGNGARGIRLDTRRVRPRNSVSPITPRSSYRHATSNLRGRKSTSSSISSVRSFAHHSKASSISSNSIETINSPARSLGRSPHTSIKVLPMTPSGSQPNSNSRYQNEAASGLLDPGTETHSLSSSVMFARRKKSPFKGSSIAPIFHNAIPPSQASPAIRPRESSASHISLGLRDVLKRNAAPPRQQRKSQIIEEEEEAGDEDGEIEEIEEVDQFEPVDLRRGERVHSIVIWDDPPDLINTQETSDPDPDPNSDLVSGAGSGKEFNKDDLNAIENLHPRSAETV